MDINEIIFTLRNIPYFKVYVKSHGRVVKQFTQRAGANDDSAQAFFLVCESIKCAWWKPYTPVIDGLKFITYVDLENAIPLKFETETVYLSTDYTTKTIERITIKEDEIKQKKKVKSGMPDKLVEIDFPPEVLYEKVQAHFIKKILTPPPDKLDLLKNKWLILGALGLIAFFWIQNGGLS